MPENTTPSPAPRHVGDGGPDELAAGHVTWCACGWRSALAESPMQAAALRDRHVQQMNRMAGQ